MGSLWVRSIFRTQGWDFFSILSFFRVNFPTRKRCPVDRLRHASPPRYSESRGSESFLMPMDHLEGWESIKSVSMCIQSLRANRDKQSHWWSWISVCGQLDCKLISHGPVSIGLARFEPVTKRRKVLDHCCSRQPSQLYQYPLQFITTNRTALSGSRTDPSQVWSRELLGVLRRLKISELAQPPPSTAGPNGETTFPQIQPPTHQASHSQPQYC